MYIHMYIHIITYIRMYIRMYVILAVGFCTQVIFMAELTTLDIHDYIMLSIFMYLCQVIIHIYCILVFLPEKNSQCGGITRKRYRSSVSCCASYKLNTAIQPLLSQQCYKLEHALGNPFSILHCALCNVFWVLNSFCSAWWI